MRAGEHGVAPAYLVPAVDKAIGILDVLRTEGGELTIAEIAKATGWHKSTVHKLLVTLHHHGLVARDEGTKRYSLGLALADYARVALHTLDVRRVARPYLTQLMECCGETAVLGILQGTMVVIVDKQEPPIQIRVTPFLGWRFPAAANGIGRALLAWLPQERAQRMVEAGGLPAATPKSITDPAVLWADLAATRERGYSVEHEDFHEGVNGVAAPVFDSRGQVVAALALGGPTFRMTEEKMREYGEKCTDLAARLSGRL